LLHLNLTTPAPLASSNISCLHPARDLSTADGGSLDCGSLDLGAMRSPKVHVMWYDKKMYRNKQGIDAKKTRSIGN